MLTSTYSDRFLDVRGQATPMMIMTVAKAMKQLGKGQILAVCAKDNDAKRSITAWAAKTGNSVLEMTERHGLLTFYIQRAS
ncbi:MAG TPA: sulfurtransferase TusA family protein [Ktedonobacterales bacterium]|nr:sulfurtransferase TusA family protein [Ktedonobacterales bacterium]